MQLFTTFCIITASSDGNITEAVAEDYGKYTTSRTTWNSSNDLNGSIDSIALVPV